MVKIIIFLSLFLLLLVFVTFRQGAKYRDFIAASDRASGIIINKEEVPKRADQPHRKEYVITYSYQVGGVDYLGRDSVEYQDLWLDMQDGQKLEIYYLRENPKQSYPVLLLDRRARLLAPIFH